jgi:hypothetical protein
MRAASESRWCLRGAFRRIIENRPASANQINNIADIVGAAGFRGLFVRGTIPLRKRLQLALKSPLAMGEQNEKSNRRCFQEKSNSRCFQYGRSIHHRDRNIYFCPNPTCLREWHQGMPVASTAYLGKIRRLQTNW